MKQFRIALGLLAIVNSVLSAPVAEAVGRVATESKVDDIFYPQREGWGTCCKEGAVETKRSETTTDDMFYPQREGWGTINAAVEAKRSEANVDDVSYPQREGWGTITPAIADANGARTVSQ
jgi:hypothetical protein